MKSVSKAKTQHKKQRKTGKRNSWKSVREEIRQSNSKKNANKITKVFSIIKDKIFKKEASCNSHGLNKKRNKNVTKYKKSAEPNKTSYKKIKKLKTSTIQLESNQHRFTEQKIDV